MGLIEKLKRPFAKRFRKVADRFRGFIAPIKSAIHFLLGLFPNPEGFAGSEDLGEESPPKDGLCARFKKFKVAFKGLSDFQKLVLLTIAVVLPAGILVSTKLVGFVKQHKMK